MKVRGPRSSTKAEAWRGTWGGLVLGEVRVPSGPRNLRNRHRLGNRFQHSDRQTILPSTCPAASHGTWATLNICTTKTHAIRTSDLPAAVGRSRDASIIVPPSTIPTPTHPQFPFPSRCCLHVPVFTLGHTHTPSEPIHLSQCSTSPLLKSKSRPGVESPDTASSRGRHPSPLPPSPPIHGTTNARNISIPDPGWELRHSAVQARPFRHSQPQKQTTACCLLQTEIRIAICPPKTPLKPRSWSPDSRTKK